MKLRLPGSVERTLSFRLSLKVLLALAILLMAALFVMFFFSRKALKEEALQKAEQSLEATVQHIDNVLLEVEEASGNVYWKLFAHIHEPDVIDEYCRKLVESNSYIKDCTIHWNTDSTSQDSGEGGAEIVMPYWTDPQIEEDSTAVTSFCLPVYVGQRVGGMLTVDVSLTLLSKIVVDTKPSPNSYCTLIGRDGTYIVHPDTNKLNSQTPLLLAHKGSDPSVAETIKSMLAGEKGYRPVRLHGRDYYVFYKPFERSEVPGRSTEKLGWSAGIVYPENDIFGEYNRLLNMVLVIAVVGLLLLLLLGQTFIHRQLLPLRLLSNSAQRIADGCYDEPIPDSLHHDEIGRLQNHFLAMQQSLTTRMGEMNQLSETLKERGQVLQAAYEQAQSADRMKTSFLYNMSNQMMTPVSDIFSDVKVIQECYDRLTREETNELADEILLNGEKITALLNQLIVDSKKE